MVLLSKTLEYNRFDNKCKVDLKFSFISTKTSFNKSDITPLSTARSAFKIEFFYSTLLYLRKSDTHNFVVFYKEKKTINKLNITRSGYGIILQNILYLQ